MGRFDSYLTGKMEIKVGDESLELDVRMKDKRKMKGLVGKSDVDEVKLKIIDDTIMEILVRSYPTEKKEALESFYTKNDVIMLNELLIGFGWLKREQLEKTKNE